MRSPFMPNLFENSSPEHPDRDLHTILRDEKPRRSNADTMRSIVRTFSASKTLNQVLGLRRPEPFVLPPSLPSGLTERLESALSEYKEPYAGVLAPRRTESLTTFAPVQRENTPLEDIVEEKESPMRASTPLALKDSMTSRSTISVPSYISEKQVVAAAQRFNAVDSDGDAADKFSNRYTDYVSDEGSGSWAHGSSTTLAVSDISRPDSAPGPPSLPPPSFPPRTSSLLPLPSLSNTIAPQQPSLVSKKLSSGRRPALTRHIGPSNSPHLSGDDLDRAHIALKRSGSSPVLLSLPVVVPTFTESVEDELARRQGSRYIDPKLALVNNHINPSQDTIPPPAPRIVIQAPSPVKSLRPRKRAPSPTAGENYDPPLTQRARCEGTTGLPLLPPEVDAEWKIEFPGNTGKLMTILLTWSHTMWSLYRRSHDSKLFPGHPAFAYPIAPPVRKELISMSLYDTSIEPNQEVRFLGPGDATEMSYNEVDVFEDLNSKSEYPASPKCSSRVGIIKHTLGLMDKEATQHIRHMTMSQRARTGQGRWCYVLIKGHSPLDRSAPPYLMLAWHISAVTSTSNYLHTVYTESAEPLLSHVPRRKKVKRFSSLQNFGQTLRGPTNSEFRQNLRASSSSSELTSAISNTTTQPREGVTLHRTIITLKKAGRIPLIEGHKVDVRAFKSWMEACGKGEGKVILWKKREVER